MCILYLAGGADEGETRERESRRTIPSINCEWAAGSREDGFLEPFTASAQVEIHAHNAMCVFIIKSTVSVEDTNGA